MRDAGKGGLQPFRLMPALSIVRFCFGQNCCDGTGRLIIFAGEGQNSTNQKKENLSADRYKFGRIDAEEWMNYLRRKERR